MSNSAGPKIVRDSSLIVNIDPANYKSYPAGQDPYVNSVSLMLDFEGSFSDKSINNLIVTANGNAQISTTQVKFGNSSGYFDGVGDYLTIANSSLFAMGSGAFTIEFWYYPLASLTNGGLVDLRSSAASSTGLLIRQGDGASSGTTITCWAGTAGGTTPATQTGLNLNAWNHIAVVRDSSNNLTVYINGVGGTSVTRAINLTDQNFRFAAFIDATGSPNAANGYFDDFRITKGVARFTSNFTPPSAPLPLPGRLTDVTSSKAVGTITSTTFDSTNQGSLVFNGTSSNVYYPSNTLYSFGTGDFTLESFVTVNAATTIKPIAQNDPVGTSQNDKWWLAYDSSVAGLRFGRHFTSTYASCAWTPVSGQWYHVAAVRSSNLMYFYINGISQSVTNQTSMSGISYSQNGLSIGAMSTPYYLNGKIASFKMYNKGLTSTEIYNNFAANRGRFGV